MENDNIIPTPLDGEWRRVDSILHIFDLHACNLPDYYASEANNPRKIQKSHMPGPWSLLDKNRKPHVQIAGEFKNSETC